MKHIFLPAIFLFITFASQVSAQAPSQMNYQAVVRDMSGSPVTYNTPVALRFVIHDLTDNGAIVYADTVNVLANQIGLVSAVLGSGASLASVNWGSGAKYLEVDAEINNSGTFINMGTSQLLSVPYALFAGNAAVGPAGATGPAGINGATGPVGPIGTTGANGLNGTNGATGATGAAGVNGVDGAAGPMGPTGAAGANGLNGTNGATGAAGPTGANGVDGATGPIGPIGAAGANGLNGTNGATGATGPAGVNGLDGATGPAGPAGADGINGTDGATGATGPAGVNGADGAAGPMGPTGATGANGTNGTPGINSYTSTTAGFIQPAVNGNVTAYVANYSWMVQYQMIYVGSGGYYTVTQINSDGNNDGALLLTYTGGGNVAAGSSVSSGAGVSPAGATGPGALATSPSLVTVNTGVQTFTVQAGLPYLSGDRVRVLNSPANYMLGNITSYAGVTLVVNVDSAAGGGSYANWNIAPIGITGPAGPAGLLPVASAAGNTPYWNGSAWVVNSNNLYNSGTNVGINTSAPASALSVGSSSQFQVDSNGNMPKINNVPYSWPTTQGSAQSVLLNDGAGNLTWGDSVNLAGGALTGHIRVSSLANVTLDYADFFVVVNGGVTSTITFPIPSAGIAGKIIIVRNATSPTKSISFTTASGSYMVGQGQSTPAPSISNGNSNVGEVNIRFICDGTLWWTW